MGNGRGRTEDVHREKGVGVDCERGLGVTVVIGMSSAYGFTHVWP